MRIGIDIDDTLAETSKYIMPLLMDFDKKHARGKGIVKAHRKHHDAFEWTEEELACLRDNYIDDIISPILPKKDVAYYVSKIRNLGHEIIVITARSSKDYKDPYALSKDWLDKHNIPFDELRANSLLKGEVCMDAKIDLFIDDSFGQSSYVAENLKIPVLMPVDDYNSDKECEGITKVHSWEEIYNKVLEMSS